MGLLYWSLTYLAIEDSLRDLGQNYRHDLILMNVSFGSFYNLNSTTNRFFGRTTFVSIVFVIVIQSKSKTYLNIHHILLA